jgi:hypothetical protein
VLPLGDVAVVVLVVVVDGVEYGMYEYGDVTV